jgi:hypothetical protein
MNQLELAKAAEMPVATRPEAPNIGMMLKGVLEKGITPDSVAAVEQLVKLFREEQDRQAERDFAQAFVLLQQDIPRIKATQPVPNRDGTTRFKFAPFEEIDRQLRPLALKHGFTYAFAEGDSDEKRITKICTVQHISGHKRSNPFTVRIGGGPPGSSESQADGAAHTYAKRGALCDAFSIVVEHQDTDARLEGGNVTEEQAFELERRVAETNSNRDAFLKFAGAKSYREIAATKYEILDGFLRKKEKGGR